MVLVGLSISGCNFQQNGKSDLSVENVANFAEDVVNTTEKATERIQGVVTDAKNTISSFNGDVQKLKSLEFTEQEFSFTLEDVFNNYLEQPQWETKTINDMTVVIVSGVVSEKFSNLTSTEGAESGTQKTFDELIQKKAKLAWVFPFKGGTLVGDQVATYFEVDGQKIQMPTNQWGGSMLQELVKNYATEKKKAETK